MTAAERIHVAVQAVHLAGNRIRPGSYGVEAGLAGSWRIDRGGVSLIGAAVYGLQPQWRDPREDPAEALARELGVSIPWLDGVQDGWEREPHDSRQVRLATSQLYLAGYEAGVVLRNELTGECRECRIRRWRIDERCHRCGSRGGVS